MTTSVAAVNEKKPNGSAGASPQRIAVFQQQGSGERKITGLRAYGGNAFVLQIVSIDQVLPDFLEDGRAYLPDDLRADLVLDYLKHQDLSHDLVALCAERDIPIISSGKKLVSKWVHTPPTCCGLPRLAGLGEYGVRFGAPEFAVRIENGLVAAIDIVRGAPCGATWDAARRVIGLAVSEAVRKIGLDVQFYCCANPAGWDPIYGKSPVHFAGRVHSGALLAAIEKALGAGPR